MTTWARSEGYGTAVVLGPTQAVVYRYVLGLTGGGRRPEVTLARMAADLGKPVSSVHTALGRLRALGLIGYASRMGRTGATRLWRVVSRTAGDLDIARHKRAVARIMRRWSVALVRSDPRTAETPAGIPETPSGRPGNPHPDGPSFGDRMRQAGFRPWWEDRGNAEPDTETDGQADTLGLVT